MTRDIPTAADRFTSQARADAVEELSTVADCAAIEPVLELKVKVAHCRFSQRERTAAAAARPYWLVHG